MKNSAVHYEKKYIIINWEASISSILTVLAIITIVAEWSAWMIIALSLNDDPAYGYFEPRSKPFIYYLIHGTSIFTLILSGILAILKGEYHKMDKISWLCFWILILTNVSWAMAAYNINDFLSWKALGATGPLVWISCIFIFVGMDQSIWQKVDRIIPIIAYMTAFLSVIKIVTTRNLIIDRWFSSYIYFSILLMWYGGWTFLTITQVRGWHIITRALPYIMFIMLAILSRTRSWFLMSLILFIMAAILIKRTEKKDQNKIIKKQIGLYLALFFLFLMISLFFGGPLYDSYLALKERAFIDSRSGQYIKFFDQVPISDLILGRGPNGTWRFQGKDYQHFDNAYLWMLFIGGIPTLLTYFMIVIWPGIKTFFMTQDKNLSASATMLILWGLACSGFSTYTNPSITPYCFLLYLLSGRCISYLNEIKRDNINYMNKIKKYNYYKL